MTFIEYPDSMEDSFHHGPFICQKMAPAMAYIVDFFMLVYQLGTCSCYFIFIASQIAAVADIYGFHLKERIWMIILLIPIMLMNLIRDLHYPVLHIFVSHSQSKWKFTPAVQARAQKSHQI
uniref:Amino acid transporter transmembrane domain-containing protein n=1 Tax=Cacopsylla melanoneura TaxID=428564 RepID=A0A8D9FA33_9HEMI